MIDLSDWRGSVLYILTVSFHRPLGVAGMLMLLLRILVGLLLRPVMMVPIFRG